MSCTTLYNLALTAIDDLLLRKSRLVRVSIRMKCRAFTRWLSYRLFTHRLLVFKGVNVLITYQCNMKCSYCYEHDLVPEHKDMSVVDFERVLRWLKRNRIGGVILLGGEPSRHPHFGEFVGLCRSYGMKMVLLTNMTFNDECQNILNAYGSCVLQANINHPQTYLNGVYERVVAHLDALHRRIFIVLRYNLSKENEDFRPIIQLASHIGSPIRFSLISIPHDCEGGGHHQEFLVHPREIVISFLEACRRKNVLAIFARPVPECMFTHQEVRRYRRNAIKFKCRVGKSCDYAARVNVNPDRSTLPCYGIQIPGPALTSFKNYRALSDFYKNHFLYLRQIPCHEYCRSCVSFQEKTCQGGCLTGREKMCSGLEEGRLRSQCVQV